MYRRKKRAKSTWLPVLGTTLADGDSSYAAAQERSQYKVHPSSAQVPNFVDSVGGEVFALLPDQTPDISQHDANFTLRDYVEGQEYLLDSIVGTVDVQILSGATGQDDLTVWPWVMVTAAIFVGDADNGEGELTPDYDPHEIDPNNVDNMARPWIWRRSWLLGNPTQESSLTVWTPPIPGTSPPSNNSWLTGDRGRSIDTKSKRRIRRNQRLWWVSTAYGVSPQATSVTGTDIQQPSVFMMLDLRICGKMRRAHNTSTL